MASIAAKAAPPSLLGRKHKADLATQGRMHTNIPGSLRHTHVAELAWAKHVCSRFRSLFRTTAKSALYVGELNASRQDLLTTSPDIYAGCTNSWFLLAHFFFPGMVFALPFRVLELVFVLCPRTGKPYRHISQFSAPGNNISVMLHGQSEPLTVPQHVACLCSIQYLAIVLCSTH